MWCLDLAQCVGLNRWEPRPRRRRTVGWGVVVRAWIFLWKFGGGFWVLGGRWGPGLHFLSDVLNVAGKGQGAEDAGDESDGEGSEDF